MSDLVGNPEDRFSRVAAHIKLGYKGVFIARTCFHGVEIHFESLTSCYESVALPLS